MADIFLSYNEKDRELVRRLAQTLQAAGWSVWWDRRVPAGQTWRQLLEQELQDMRCMLVLWSSHSVKSEWVCEEAAEGRLLGRLIPVFIEHVRPPAGFREVQAADLIGWDGTPEFAGLRQLLLDIEHKLGAPGAAVSTDSQTHIETDSHTDGKTKLANVPPPVPHRFRPLWQWGVAALLLSALAGGYFWLRPSKPDAPMEVKRPEATSNAPPPTAALPRSPVSAVPVATASEPHQHVQTKTAAPPLRSPVNPRCAALRERQALGESLSSQSQLFVEKECSK